MGIHLGDIVRTENDVFGDGVNLASRIQTQADVGTVLISEKIYAELHNHPEIKTKSLGYFKLKNVSDRIRIHAIVHEDILMPSPSNVWTKIRRSKGWGFAAAPTRFPPARP